MSAQTVIDSLEFARAAQELRGRLPVTNLVRLQDCLVDADGSVDFVVKGGRDAERRPILALEISGLLHLQCQGCLGPLDYPLQLSNTLLLVRRGEDLGADADDPEAADCIEADPALDLAPLIEDEILLSLPFAPRHADGSCQSVLSAMRREGSAPAAFAKLAALKKGSGQ